MSRYRLDREHGRKRRVDSTPVVNHIRTLLNAGWNQRQISDAAQCANRVIANLASNKQPTTRGDIARRILAISPYPVPAPVQYTDATGTMRRVRALVAIGYPISHIAAAISIWPSNLSRIARGELAQVNVVTASTTTAVYRELSRRPGPSQGARARAQRQGWHGPLAWDTDIDDPAAQPDMGEEPAVKLPAELSRCGTAAAYRRHLRRKEPIDQACRDANRLASQERDARMRAKRVAA